MSSASVLLLLVSLTSIDVRGPTAVLHATAFSEFRVFKGDTPITAFRYENDTLYLPDSGSFTVVFDTLALKPSYSYGGNARSDRAPQPDTVNANPAMRSTWLKIKGDRRIGLMVGRSVSVRQSLDILIDGRLTDSVEVEGRLSDNDVNANQDVFANRLSDFQSASIILRSRSLKLQLGDLSLPNDASLKYRGVSMNYELPHSTSYLTVAYSRSSRRKVAFVGADGKQGPYFLRGPDGENVTIVPLSEHVTVNSIEMRRGIDHDYTIDYEQGTLVFTPSRPIRDGDSIVVSFAYIQDAYARRIMQFGTDIEWLKIAATESKDDISGLSDEDIATISHADSASWISGYRFVGRGKGDYQLQDDHFVFVGAGRGDYIVHFEYVGDGKGDYEYLAEGYFRYVGQGSGAFRVGRRVSPPSYDRMVSFSMSKWLNINALAGFHSDNLLNPTMRRKIYLISADFERKIGMAGIGVRFGARSSDFPMRLMPMDFMPISYMTTTLKLGSMSRFIGIRMFTTRDTNYRTHGSELIFGFNGDASVSGSMRSEIINLRPRRSLKSRFGVGGFFAAYSDVSGDTSASSISVGYNSEAFRTTFQDKRDARGSHRVALVAFSHSWSSKSGISLSGNIFVTNDTVRKTASFIWRYGFLRGSHEINYGASFMSMDIYQFVGEGNGNYSFDPASGRYYQDDGGSYIKVRKRLPSKEPSLWFKNHVETAYTSDHMNFMSSITLDNGKNGSYHHRADMSARIRLTERLSVSANFNGFKSADPFAGELLDYNGELRLERDRISAFGGAGRSRTSYMPERRNIWAGAAFRHGKGDITAKVERISGAAEIDVLSVSQDINIPVGKIPISFSAEAYYGFLKSVRDSRMVTPLTMPIGFGYRYRITASQKIRDKTDLKVTLNGTRFRTHFYVSLDMKF